MGFLPDRSKVVLRYILERQGEKRPNSVCVSFEDGERWTYGQAIEEAYKAANALSEYGIKRLENVLVFLPNSRGWLRAWWGITFLGAIIVPVNTAYKGEMLRHICSDSQAKHIIATPDLAERIKDLDPDLNIIDPAILVQGSQDEPKLDEPIEPWDMHMLLYTSGTTGPSKGVLLPYFKCYIEAEASWGAVATSHDTFLLLYGLFHVAPLSQCYALWMAGGCVALRTFSASRFLKMTRECGATLSVFIGTVPQFLEKMPPKPDDFDNPLRFVVCLPMPNDPDAFMSRFGIEKLVMYFGVFK